eukprot:5581008-Alexandrium_andersonii.AAC.1
MFHEAPQAGGAEPTDQRATHRPDDAPADSEDNHPPRTGLQGSLRLTPARAACASAGTADGA